MCVREAGEAERTVSVDVPLEPGTHYVYSPATKLPQMEWRDTGLRPSDAELEVDLFTILREPGVLGPDVSAEDIDAKRIADRLAELGWVRS